MIPHGTIIAFILTLKPSSQAKGPEELIAMFDYYFKNISHIYRRRFPLGLSSVC
jgi:hypothetical protein